MTNPDRAIPSATDWLIRMSELQRARLELADVTIANLRAENAKLAERARDAYLQGRNDAPGENAALERLNAQWKERICELTRENKSLELQRDHLHEQSMQTLEDLAAAEREIRDLRKRLKAQREQNDGHVDFIVQHVLKRGRRDTLVAALTAQVQLLQSVVEKFRRLGLED